MSEAFSHSVYYGYLVKGDLPGAIRYVRQFPDQAERYDRFMAVFEREEYRDAGVDSRLNEVLRVYQRYYRNAFYLRIGKENAENKLREEFAALFGADDSAELSAIEQECVAKAFESREFCFLGGRTGGYYGPYIWRTTQTKAFEVELPDGIQTYRVKLLDGFISRSWLDHLSFGEIGTGGWTDGDGIINCVASSYDVESEDFKVSLLKHEAQHARDLAMHKGMSSEELEYRAKLVELIYSQQRNLLEQFAREADGGDQSNGHSAASGRIVEGFIKALGKRPAEFKNLAIGDIQATARRLFKSSHSQF